MEAQIRKKNIRKEELMNTDADIFSYDDKNVETVIESTGLPSDLIRKWLFLETSKRGINHQDMSLQNMRDLLSEVLQEMILSQS